MTALIIILILLFLLGTIQCINSCYKCSFLDQNRAYQTCYSDSCMMSKCPLDHEPCTNTNANYCLHDGKCCQLKEKPSDVKFCSCQEGYGGLRCQNKDFNSDYDKTHASKVSEILICNVEHSRGNVGKCTVRDYGEVECDCFIVTETTTSPNIKEVIGEQSYRSDCVSITQSVSIVTISFLVMRIVIAVNHQS